MRIRAARETDAEDITAIYNDAVVNTTAIWNEATVDAANRVEWMRNHRAAGCPVLVAVDSADVALGYATFGEWRDWDGYRHTVEHSVYVRADRRGQGFGKALLGAIIEEARRIGKHVMVAGITSENAGSIRLHEDLGFVRVGDMPQVGAKFGRWLDLTFMQLILDDRSSPGPAAD
jgi:phosphinothricin acetyltransferase